MEQKMREKTQFLLFFSQILDLQGKLKQVSNQISSANEHIKVVFTNQSRLRENIKSLEKITDSELVKRYLSDLYKVKISGKNMSEEKNLW